MDDDVDNELTDVFDHACSYVRSSSGSFDAEKLLHFYSFYKQATEGPCNTSKPGFFDFQGKSKWDAWKKLGGMTKPQAMHEYIKFLSSIVPDWEAKLDEPDKGDGQGKTWISVSTMSNTDTEIADENKTIFDWCKEGNTQEVAQLINKGNVNTTDDFGMTLLHWACDRGFRDMVEILLNVKADINALDSDNQTALHYAVCCHHKDIVEILLSHGINTSITDSDGLKASELDTTPEITSLLSQTICR